MKTRRQTLQALGSLALSAPFTQAAPTVAVPSRIIDTHTHFYDPTRPEGVPWPEPKTALYRTVLPPDWLALSGKHGIKETVVVEASKWLADNDWILQLAEREKCIVGFVGRVEPDDANFAQHVKRLSGNAIFRGIRMSGEPLLKTEAVTAAAKVMVEHDLSLDVNGLKSMAPVIALAKAVPELRIIIDHCGGCGDAQKLRPGWKEGMAEVATYGNVFCKVSALVESLGGEPGKAPSELDYYLPVLDHLWAQFGVDRVVFGSNWPVSDRGAHFDVVMKLVTEYFGSKGQDAAEKYFWRNSLAVYKWLERR